jgi:hypothetical protein
VLGMLSSNVSERSRSSENDPRRTAVSHPDATSAVAATTSATNSVRSEALRLVTTARSRIMVSSFGWDVEHEVVRRLCARAREGVDVKVLARVRPPSMPALLALAERRCKSRGVQMAVREGHLHRLRAGPCDVGEPTSRWARSWFRAWCQADGEPRQRGDLPPTRRVNCAEWHLVVAPDLGDAIGRVLLWQRDQLTDVEVRPSMDVDLGTVTATSAHDLVAQRPLLPSVGQRPRLAHEQRCAWTVCATSPRSGCERGAPRERFAGSMLGSGCQAFSTPPQHPRPRAGRRTQTLRRIRSCPRIQPIDTPSTRGGRPPTAMVLTALATTTASRCDLPLELWKIV